MESMHCTKTWKKNTEQQIMGCIHICDSYSKAIFVSRAAERALLSRKGKQSVCCNTLANKLQVYTVQ